MLQNNNEDFDVEVSGGNDEPAFKRQRKEQKFGKTMRKDKRNNAESAADLSRFNREGEGGIRQGRRQGQQGRRKGRRQGQWWQQGWRTRYYKGVPHPERHPFHCYHRTLGPSMADPCTCALRCLLAPFNDHGLVHLASVRHGRIEALGLFGGHDVLLGSAAGSLSGGM